jgi:Fe-S cluster assembly protein SufD
MTAAREGTMKGIELYRAEFDSLNGAPEWVTRLRRQGMARFSALGFPTVRLEDWKYTDIAPIAQTPFRLAGASSPTEALRDLASRSALGCGCRLVFVNGRYNETLSAARDLPNGVTVVPLWKAFDVPGVRSHLGAVADTEAHSFTALNTAFLQDGAAVHLARGVVVEEPIHLLFLSAGGNGEPAASHPRILVLAEESSEAVVVEDYVGEDSRYLTNAVSEIVVGDNAKIDHYKLQREGEAGYHIATVEARQGRDSRLRSYAVSLGGALARVAINTTFAAEGGECSFDGLYMAAGSQHVDHHTTIDHRQPRCTSRELYKGVLDDKATGVFSGRVYVRPQAQKSDAMQMNKNLLLSDQATVDSKPQLEIFADDVKCSHGATIGQLDEKALFYLRSRGIEVEEARALLIRAFANELIDRLGAEPVRAQLQATLRSRWGWENGLETGA